MKASIVFLFLLFSLTGYAQTNTRTDSTLNTRLGDCLWSTKPLYVVDNKIISCDSIKYVKVQNIEKIEVFKGIEAERLYGAAARRNGALVITTRHYAALRKRESELSETEKP